MEPAVEIRVRETSDLPNLIKILRAVYAVSGYPVIGIDDPIPFIAPPDSLQAWVATLNRQIVGQIVVMKPSPEDQAVEAFLKQGGQLSQVGSVVRLFVDPRVHGVGLGKMLIRHAVSWAGGVGKRLVLYVLDKDMSAMGLYEKLGWTRIGEGTFQNPEGKIWTSFSYISPEAALTTARPSSLT